MIIKNNNHVEVVAISLSKIKTQTYTTLKISIILENFNIKVTLKKKKIASHLFKPTYCILFFTKPPTQIITSTSLPRGVHGLGWVELIGFFYPNPPWWVKKKNQPNPYGSGWTYELDNFFITIIIKLRKKYINILKKSKD